MVKREWRALGWGLYQLPKKITLEQNRTLGSYRLLCLVCLFVCLSPPKLAKRERLTDDSNSTGGRGWDFSLLAVVAHVRGLTINVQSTYIFHKSS